MAQKYKSMIEILDTLTIDLGTVFTSMMFNDVTLDFTFMLYKQCGAFQGFKLFIHVSFHCII